ncbi:2-keto-3-deoxygluconate permease [Arthrobacter ruber]|uniref:2-keto-3-deoxygluconate permease n=1 Tax=Arthrobacter ruber TaxID=1258893 RepID=UPI000CF3EFEE|nr:2-keto-3-deoxygluconate permease [Arthrobacter ruber]
MSKPALPGFLELGSFTTALFADSALPLIAVLIFATGMQITAKASGPVLATTGGVLLFNTIIRAALVAGLGNIPFLTLLTLLAAAIPVILGFIIGSLDAKWTEVMRPVPSIVIPIFAFALGTGIDLRNVIAGDISGIFVGTAATLITGTLVYIGYRFVLRRGAKAGSRRATQATLAAAS